MTKEELLENLYSERGVIGHHLQPDEILDDVEYLESQGKSYDEIWEQIKLWEEMEDNNNG